MEDIASTADVKQATLNKKTTDGLIPTEVVVPNYQLSLWWHILKQPNALKSQVEKDEAKARLMAEIKRDEMLPFYKQLCKEFDWTVDTAFEETLLKANELELKSIEESVTEAKENYGDVELKDRLLSKAHFLCRIGDMPAAIAAYEVAHEKTVGSGSKLEILLTLIRIGLITGDQALVKKNMARAKVECEKGGDWERRNKLKIYEGIHLAGNRHFKEAATLFIDCIAIFTATELMTFETFVFYTLTLSLLAMDRPQLKASIIGSPEIAQVLSEDRTLNNFLHSFYECNYVQFMESLVDVSQKIRCDFFLNKHYRYFVRTVRLRAYQQFLEPFKSITVKSMANQFGVSELFLEEDVADYIANGKLNCKIDREKGVIENSRSNKCNDLYNEILKQGDLLLGKIQKLSKIIDM